MWSTNNYWFDTAVVFGIFAVGNILLGHFEAHKPKWKRLAKMLIFLGLAVSLSALGLRWILWIIIFIFGCIAIFIHTVWLPKQGINGWTGEPREEYLKLVLRQKHVDARDDK